MFVKEHFRGSMKGIARRLLRVLLDWCKLHDVHEMYLGTTTKFLAAHRFYEKNCFSEIKQSELPASFPVMTVDTKFYQYFIDNGVAQPDQGSPITNTHIRNAGHAADISGMCAVCTADCVGPCEIGLSAIRGAEAIKAPFILPAMAKLAWKEYFAGAALAGVPVVIGEDVIAKDPGLVVDGHRVVESPLIKEMVGTFRRYYRGVGGGVGISYSRPISMMNITEYLNMPLTGWALNP
jgi:hypothetical protein